MSAAGSNIMPEMNLPSQYWNAISQDDRNEFIRLRNSFHHGQKISSKDRRIITFSKELNIVLNYLERSDDNQEARCVLCGVCFVGPIVCVNTRQLKSFLSRCKSSINGSFQQLGFVALRTKAKARNCVLTALPSLQTHQNILRQWTVRYASDDAKFCFVSSYSNLPMPEITQDDLFDEKKVVPRRSNSSNLFMSPVSHNLMQFPFNIPQHSPSPIATIQNNIINNNINNTIPNTPPIQSNISSNFLAPKPPLQAKVIDFDLPSIDDMDPIDTTVPDYTTFTSSISYERFNDIDLDLPHFLNDDEEFINEKGMKKSQSVFVQTRGEWDFLSDNFF